jgi:hypothetical protein
MSAPTLTRNRPAITSNTPTRARNTRMPSNHHEAIMWAAYVIAFVCAAWLVTSVAASWSTRLVIASALATSMSLGMALHFRSAYQQYVLWIGSATRSAAPGSPLSPVPVGPQAYPRYQFIRIST